MTFILNTNTHTHTHTQIYTLMHIQTYTQIQRKREMLFPFSSRVHISIKFKQAVAAPTTAATDAATTVVAQPKARKCLHFCTFLLSHYAKYICIVCRCFSSSFDAYVLASFSVLRALTSSPTSYYFSCSIYSTPDCIVWVSAWRGGWLGFMVVCFRFWLLRIHVLPSALQKLCNAAIAAKKPKATNTRFSTTSHKHSCCIRISSSCCSFTSSIDCVQFCIWSADSTIENLCNRRVKWASASVSVFPLLSLPQHCSIHLSWIYATS